MALAGTWYIHEQNIGSSTFTRMLESVAIEARPGGRFTTQGHFPLTGELVTFNPVSGQQYYLAQTTNYQYRAQTLESNGLTLLVGHVADRPASGDPKRCVFAGLPQSNGSSQDPPKIEDLPLVYIHLEHDEMTPHEDGKITVDRRPESGDPTIALTSNSTTTSFKIDKDEPTSDDAGLHLITSPLIDQGGKQELLQAKLIFDQNRRPIYIGYYWREASFTRPQPKLPRSADPDTIDSGQPTSQYCTRVTVGW